MNYLAIILLMACAIDIAQAMRTLVKAYRIKHDMPKLRFHLKFIKCFKGAILQVVMNLAAAIFFVAYLQA